MLGACSCPLMWFQKGPFIHAEDADYGGSEAVEAPVPGEMLAVAISDGYNIISYLVLT